MMRADLPAAVLANAGGKLSDDGVEWIPTVINFALHLLLVGSFFGFAVMLVLLVRDAKDTITRVGRYMALFIGAVIVVAVDALGGSYSDFIIDSLGESRSPAFRFFGAVLPGVAGLALGYYLTRGMKRASERALRLLLVVGTFCLTQFVLMYAAAFQQQDGELDAAVTPNVSFVVGLGLVMVMYFGIKEPDSEREEGVRGLARMFGRGRQQPAASSRQDLLGD